MKLKPRLKNTNDAKRHNAVSAPPPQNVERLVSVAIKINAYTDDEEIYHGFRSHSELRSSIGGYPDPYKTRHGDIDGFWTSEGRFLDREKAKLVGAAAGQCYPTIRELLSSDVTW